MPESSIGLSRSTKAALAAAKPPGMHWDEFMVNLLEVAEPDRFYENLESKREGSEGDAVDRARERYLKYRRSPEALVSGEELRRRVHLRRLLESLTRFQGGLEFAHANPAGRDDQALTALLDELDKWVRSARESLQAA